jgi:hypothetical protein
MTVPAPPWPTRGDAHPKTKFPAAQKDEWVRRHDAGEPMRSIARSAGASAARVQQVLHRADRRRRWLLEHQKPTCAVEGPT